jgi:hypothetical protein
MMEFDFNETNQNFRQSIKKIRHIYVARYVMLFSCETRTKILHPAPTRARPVQDFWDPDPVK